MEKFCDEAWLRSIELMGTDHVIVLAWGFRIPVKEWNAFKEMLRENAELSKRRRRRTSDDDDEDDYYDDMSNDVEDLIAEIEGHNQPPEGHGFADQCGDDDGYVFIYDLEESERLMDRKIGGALAWTTKGFEHMQSVPTLFFSVQLEHELGPEDEAERRTEMLKDVPEELADYLATLDTREYYNRWIFSYAW